MAQKRSTLGFEKAGFWLAVVVALGAAGAFVFNLGKDIGAYEQRLAQLEQRVENPVNGDSYYRLGE